MTTSMSDNTLARVKEDARKEAEKAGILELASALLDEARAHEREACAKIAETFANANSNFNTNREQAEIAKTMASAIAIQIRAFDGNAEAIIPRLEAAEARAAAAERLPLSWRCFNCDAVFTDQEEARAHFGEYKGDVPTCRMTNFDVAALRADRDAHARKAEDADRDADHLYAENFRIRAALKEISDPMLLKVDGIGTERALKIITTLQQIARAALTANPKDTETQKAPAAG